MALYCELGFWLAVSYNPTNAFLLPGTRCSLLCKSMWIISSKWTVPGSSLLNILLLFCWYFSYLPIKFILPSDSKCSLLLPSSPLSPGDCKGLCLIPLSKSLMEIWITSECDRNPSQFWHIQKQFWQWEDNCCVKHEGAGTDTFSSIFYLSPWFALTLWSSL